ncbi:hypothetical protein KIPB_014372, partial [Kipferlia bialata]|eukprot:g14372.t1
MFQVNFSQRKMVATQQSVSGSLGSFGAGSLLKAQSNNLLSQHKLVLDTNAALSKRVKKQ